MLKVKRRGGWVRGDLDECVMKSRDRESEGGGGEGRLE